MELRAYLNILRRHWWIPTLLVLLVGLVTSIQLRPWEAAPPAQYNVQLRFLLGVLPLDDADPAVYDPRYFAWLTSEYLVDDFTEVVRSQLFADQVSKRLVEQQIAIPGGAIKGSASTGKQHRIINLDFTWPTQKEAVAIANAAALELEENADFYFQQLGTDAAIATLLDGPTVSPIGPSTQERFTIPLRLFLALLAGLGIAFLVEYLDNSVRNQADVEELGLSLLGAIPKH